MKLQLHIDFDSNSNAENSFFADHFRFQAKSQLLLMYTTPLVPHVFSSFLFYQELRPFKNYRTFRFKFPDKKLVSLLRFTISPFECRWFLKICSFSFFRIRSAIAQQIASHLREYWTSFRVLIRFELDVQLYLHFPMCVVSMQNPTSRDRNFHRTHRNRRQMIST